MRLPHDAALIVIDSEGPEALEAAWRKEQLPIYALGTGGFAAAEPLLDAIGATTLTIVGEPHAAGEVAREAIALGYRVFVVMDVPLPDIGEARAVTLETALKAVSLARFRDRWAAARLKRARNPSQE